jgi:hypothetical protein
MSSGGGSAGDQFNTVISKVANAFITPLVHGYNAISGVDQQNQADYQSQVVANANQTQATNVANANTAAQNADSQASTQAGANNKAAVAATAATSQDNFNWLTPRRSDTGNFMGF